LQEHNPISRHVLNLGAGVQSTTLYLMYLRGEIQPAIECAIFADTGEEPRSIYRDLEWLKSLNGPPIITVSIGKLGEDLQNGRNSTGQRFASSFAANARASTRSIRLSDTSVASSWEWRADSECRLASRSISRTASR
jgi:hypothetical protein